MTALKKEILKRGILQNALAKKLGISEAAVSLQAKTGIKTGATAAKYAKAMKCKAHELMDF